MIKARCEINHRKANKSFKYPLKWLSHRLNVLNHCALECNLLNFESGGDKICEQMQLDLHGAK